MKNSAYTSRSDELKLSCEDQFIIQCLHLKCNNDSSNISAMTDFSALRWEIIYEKSLYWHVAPFLYRIILENQTHIPQFSHIPAHFLDKLKMVYIRALSINRINYEGLTEILEVFGREGIRVVLLKGIYLAEFIYNDIGVRPMGDVDLLVQRRDIEKAEALLLKRGYQYQFEKGTHPLVQKKLIEYCKMYSQHLYPLGRCGGIPRLEVHSCIIRKSYQFCIDDEGLWERANRVNICGENAWTLSPEDNVIYLSLHVSCAHGIIDVLKSYVDIGLFLLWDAHLLRSLSLRSGIFSLLFQIIV